MSGATPNRVASIPNDDGRADGDPEELHRPERDVGTLEHPADPAPLLEMAERLSRWRRRSTRASRPRASCAAASCCRAPRRCEPTIRLRTHEPRMPGQEEEAGEAARARATATGERQRAARAVGVLGKQLRRRRGRPAARGVGNGHALERGAFADDGSRQTDEVSGARGGDVLHAPGSLEHLTDRPVHRLQRRRRGSTVVLASCCGWTAARAVRT